MKTSSFGKQTGLLWVFDGNDPNVPGEVEVCFAAGHDERLRGTPRSFFNEPALGEALVATIPVPGVNKTMQATLAVRRREDDDDGPILVPIKIQRPA